MDEIDVKLIAFYLPQFHPIPENDLWWGEGFTEWRNVSTARPLFEGHYQPHVPADLGYYDLRVPETRKKQAELAKAHGVYGFCYYYYWFNGRRILEKPLDEVLRSGEPDFPFCICWANENWSRLWDGGNNELLLSQEHSLKSDIQFIRDVIPIMQDPRYIRVNGLPVLLLYRADLLQDPKETAAAWREECERAGLGGIHLVVVQSFNKTDPRSVGFDAACEFPPHQYKVGDVTADYLDLMEETPFHGKIFDYNVVAQHSVSRPAEAYALYQTAFPGWDNSARKRRQALVFDQASPERYEYWLRSLAQSARTRLPAEQRFVFVNAWNEWAEGAHLEPDAKYGRGYLEATRRALTNRTNWKELTQLLRETIQSDKGVTSEALAYLDEVETRLREQVDRIAYYETEAKESALHRELRNSSPFQTADIDKLMREPRLEGLKGWIETANGRQIRNEMVLAANETTQFGGWMAISRVAPHSSMTRRFIVLRKAAPYIVFAAELTAAVARPDVAKAMLAADIDNKYTAQCGFNELLNLKRVTAGVYQLGMLVTSEVGSAVSWLDLNIRVID